MTWGQAVSGDVRSGFRERLFFAYQDARIAFGLVRVVASAVLTVLQPAAVLGLLAIAFGVVSAGHALWIKQTRKPAFTSTIVIDVLGYAMVAVIVAAPAVTAMVLGFSVLLVVVFSEERTQPTLWAVYLVGSIVALVGAAVEDLPRWDEVNAFTDLAPALVMALTIGYVLAIGGREVANLEAELDRSTRDRLELIEVLPIAAWEIDYSGFVAYLTALPVSSEEELKEWLATHREEFRAAVEGSTVLTGNAALNHLFQGEVVLPAPPTTHHGGRDILEIFLPEAVQLWQGETDFRVEYVGPGPDHRGILFFHVPVRSGFPDFKHCLAMLVDVSDLHRLQRLLDLESGVYAALLDSNSEEEAFRAACETTTEIDGLVGAWAGVVDGDSPVVRIVAAAAAGDRIVPRFEVRTDASPEGEGPSGRAIRTGTTIVMKTGHPWQGPWTRLIEDNAVASVISTPLFDGDRAFGVLSVLSTEADIAPGTLRLVERIARYLAIEVVAFRARNELTGVNAELERLLADKDEFVATISHELRTPLATVFGLTQELNQQWESFPDRQRRELLGLVASESAELSDLIEDLLVVARPEERIRVLPKPISLRATFQSLIREGDGVVCEDGDAVAVGDAMRVRQVLRNFLSNARRYGGPNIRVSFDGRDAASVTVADDGPGVAPGLEERIFIPFVSAPLTKVSPAAIGLGLTVSRRLATLMDGEVLYERRDGWTRFTLRLPRAES